MFNFLNMKYFRKFKISNLDFLLLLAIVLNFIFPVQVAFANPGISARCVCDEADPFDPRERALVPTGVYTNQCQDCSKRSMFMLTSEQVKSFNEKIQHSPNDIVIGNVIHQKRFWTAFISPNSIDKVIVQLEHFSPTWIAGHIQLRLLFKKGMEAHLVPQSARYPESPVVLRNLVISAEYNAPAGVPYNVFNGFHGKNFDGLEPHYNINFLLVSLEDKIEQMITKQNHQVEQFPLVLSENEKRKLLLNAVTIANTQGMKRMYNTWTKSCVTEAFRFLDNAVDYKSRGLTRPKHIDHVPVRIENSLKERRVFVNGTQLPDLNAEIL